MTKPTPPRAAKHEQRTTLHGHERIDPYAWLRDPNWQQVLQDPTVLDDEIRAYLDAENQYSRAVMADTEALREELFGEHKGRIKEDDSTVPAKDGDYFYYRRFETGDQYPRYYRKKCARDELDGAAEQIALDVVALAEGHDFCRVIDVEHGPGHRYLAYAVDYAGSERYTIRFRDLDSGSELDEVIPECSGNFTWAADGRTLFYTVIDAKHRPKWVRAHRIGTPPESDRLVYEEPDDGFFVGVGTTESGDWIVIDAHDHTTSEARVIDAHDPAREPRLIAARSPRVTYEMTHNGDDFYILLREGDRKDGCILRAPTSSPERANWVEAIPYTPGTLIVTMLMFGRYFVRLESENALPRIRVHDLADHNEHDIAFDEEAYSLGLNPGFEYETTELRFHYSSMTTPTRIFDYDMSRRERELRKEQAIPSGHDASDYRTERLYAPARDGESVPITLLYHKDTPIDPTTPVLLYGYGSYGFSMPASFAPNRLTLVNRGLIYAIAHVRGGKDKGYAWYEQAKLENKRLTFTDFIDCAEFLVRQGYTKRGNIVAYGGSAGGMLVGAVANMAPDLFRGIVAQVPFVDVLTTMCDADLPLTPPEWPEWGNPIESREAYEYIASYSPYDNVEAKDYPHILIVAGLTDPRVTYWEPAKWIARLRELKTDDHLLLMDMEMGQGHAGASGRFDWLKKVALNDAFILKITDRADR